VSAFATVVAEVCTNIFDHSGDSGVVAAQRYTRKQDKRKYVIIAVADIGIGIRASLAKRFRDATRWTHLQSIVNALQKEYSSRPERGLGLFMVSKIVGKHDGSLHIRSGDARLYLRHRARGIPVGDFPGTQLSISLSAGEIDATPFASGVACSHDDDHGSGLKRRTLSGEIYGNNEWRQEGTPLHRKF
jgi:signal transduction histidine kinase